MTARAPARAAVARPPALIAVAIVVALAAALAPAAAAAAAQAAAAPGQLTLIFPLAVNDAGLQRLATEVSTPGSPQYGRHESLAVLARRFGASAAARAAVARYLRSVGARSIEVSATGMFLQATMSAALAQRVFATPLDRLRAADGERFLAPRAAPRLPAALRGRAIGVLGLDTEPLRAPQTAAALTGPSGYRPVTGTPSGCSRGVRTGGFTPNQYLSAYDYGPLHGAGLGGQGERVALIEIDGFKASDVRTFARCFGFRGPPVSVYRVGSGRPLAPGPEATLDLELLGAGAPRASSFEVFESRSNAVAVDQAFAAPLIAPGAKPQVVSASLGLCEPAMEAAFGTAGIRSVERNLELAAATGITMIVASGDSGSADCLDFRGQTIDGLAVDYPSASPWVTSVGGTNVRLDGANQITSEAVWNDTPVQLAAGGGGLSRLFYRPSFQSGVVASNRRAVPDISMLADIAPGYAIYCSAHAVGCRGWRTVGGTSAAAPLLAGGMALVDQDLHRHHRELIGMANPLLYAVGRSPAAASVFSDVTAGANDIGAFIRGGDGRPLGCCGAGPGFDAASGWGSIDLARFDSTALATLPQIADVSLSIPRGQRPVQRGRLSVRLSCSAACTAYAFGFVAIAGRPTLQLRSSGHRLAARRAARVAIRFSAHQKSVLRAALAGRRPVVAELFGAVLDAHGRLAEVTAGRTVAIRN